MELLIVSDGKTHWLVTSRGMVQLMSGDAINSLRDGCKIPQGNVDSQTMTNLMKILTPAP